MSDKLREPINTTGLLSLPPELLAQEILLHLPLRSLIQCLSTCRLLNKLITSSVEITYQMELEIAGMIDNPHCPYTTYPVVQRLEMLRERERRWSHFDWKWKREVEFPPLTLGTNYDLAPGLYLRGKLAHGGNGMAGLYCGSLPCDMDGGIVWMEVHLGKKIIDFTESVKNDLLACVSLVETSSSPPHASIQIDFLALSTGLPHSRAACPTLEVCTHYGPQDGLQLCIETCGENFALTYEANDRVPGSKGTLYVWNWRTGKKKAETPIGGHSGLAGLVFLQEDFFMHTNAQKNSLDIFYISPLGSADAGGGNLQIVLSLPMPQLMPDYQVRLQCMNHPSPSSLHDTLHGANTTSRPFSNDPQSEILVITSHIDHPSWVDFYKFAMLTHRKSLLELALIAQKMDQSNTVDGHLGGDPQHMTASFAWEDWGPFFTRIFSLSPNVMNADHASAGQRWSWLPDGEDYNLELVDFNQLRIRRMCQSWGTLSKTVQLPPNEGTSVTVTMDFESPMMVFSSSDRVFAQDVYSYLPCVRTCYYRRQDPNARVETIPQRIFPGPDGGQEISETNPRNLVEIIGVLMEEERIVGVYPRIEGMKAAMDVLYFG